MPAENKKKEIFHYISLIILCLFLIWFSDFMHRPPQAAKLLSGLWTVSYDGDELASEKLPLYFSGNKDDFRIGIYSFKYNLKLDSEYYNSLKRPVLVMPSNSGNGLRIRLNNRIIDIRGDLKEGRSSLWNIQHALFLPKELITEYNDIDVELYGLYEAGINRIPYITDAGGIFRLKLLCMIWTPVLIFMLIGGFLVIGTIFLITGFASGKKDLQQAVLGFATIFISIFLLDYSFISDTVFSYVIFKKIIVASQFMALAFFILFVTYSAGLLGHRFSYLIVVFHFVLAVVTILLPGDMIALRKFYRIVDAVTVFLFVYLVYLFLVKVEHKFDMIAIYSGGFTALIFSLHDVVCLFDDKGQIFLSQYGFVFLFVSGAIVIIFRILGSYVESVRQRDRAEQLYRESMKDALTGAYNRKILPVIEQGLKETYSVLLFDLDDFKKINDYYGHGAGDLALQSFVKSMSSYVRNNDYIIRAGGDEFVVILPGCTYAVAENQGVRILKHLAENIISFGENSFFVKATFGTATMPSGSPLSEAISEADKMMYQNKKNKRVTGL